MLVNLLTFPLSFQLFVFYPVGCEPFGRHYPSSRSKHMPDALLSFSFLLVLVIILYVLGSQFSLETFYIAGGTQAFSERRGMEERKGI